MNRQIKGSGQKGFTLIELVIVLVLLSILVAVAVPKYQSFTTDARGAAGDAARNVVLSAYSIETGVQKGEPTANQLVSRLAFTTGDVAYNNTSKAIDVTLGDDANAAVALFPNADCTGSLTDGDTAVLCVGDVTVTDPP